MASMFRVILLIAFIDSFYGATGVQHQGPCRVYENGRFANCSFRFLHSVPKQLKAHGIRNLDLSHNQFEKLKSGTFRKFQELEVLNLDNNRVATIEPDSFLGLTQLTNLTIRNNRLKIQKDIIPKHLFLPLRNLKYLHVDGNGKEPFSLDLHIYPDEAFSYLSKLESLSLDLYPTPEFGIGFETMEALKTVKFDRCKLLELKNETFKNFSSSVRELYVTNCLDINPHVGIAAFEHFVNLKVLDLSNSLVSLPSAMNLLYGLQNNTMDIINFYKVNTNMLAGKLTPYSVVLTAQNTYYLRQVCVKRLNIAFNEIVEVGKGSLFGLKRFDCLEEFTVSGNRFDLLYSLHLHDILRFFSEAINLQYIDFSYMAVEFPNYLYTYTPLKPRYKGKFKRSLFVNSFCLYLKCPPKLHTLRFNHLLWYLQNIKNLCFEGCKNISVLDLSYSSIQYLNFSISGIQTATTLDISGIDISAEFPLILNSVPQLKNLYINSVNLDKFFDKPVGDTLFRSTKYVEEISMSKNHLRNIPNLVFRDLKNLKHINLSSNSLEQFPTALLDVYSLKSLDLSNNKLTTFPEKIITWLEMVAGRNGNVKLSLRGNLFSCKCENSHFVKWLFTTKIRFDTMKNYSCVLDGGKISNTIYVNEHYSEIFVNCVSTFWLVFSVVFSVILFLVLITSVIAFRFRWRISYFFHRYMRQDIDLIDIGNYVYNAFVAYPADDYQWVWRELRVQMEENFGLKLCLHDREFVPGETISQNIHNFMQKSRKIIFVLTPGFVAAKWFEYELETAKMDMLERRNNKGIIVIIRNGMQPEQMPRAIGNIWHNITCLTWPDDEDVVAKVEAEEMFWKRLRDVLES